MAAKVWIFLVLCLAEGVHAQDGKLTVGRREEWGWEEVPVAHPAIPVCTRL